MPLRKRQAFSIIRSRGGRDRRGRRIRNRSAYASAMARKSFRRRPRSRFY